MHDMDRTTLEMDYADEMAYDDREFEYDDEFEFENEYDGYEYDDEYDGYEYDDEYVGYEYDDEYDEYDDEFEYDYDLPFSEEDEMELAADLLSISNEMEYEEFIKKLWKKAKRGARKLWRRYKNPIKGALKKLARKGLSWGGRALGTYFGGPAGGALGSKAGNWAAKAFGLELEGLSPEDQEFEVARRLVRLTGDTINNVGKMPPSVPKNVAVKKAMKKAAAKHAPGLLKRRRFASSRRIRRGSRPLNKFRGTWIRHGNRIILKEM